MSIQLSVIICTYNRYHTLPAAINSIEVQHCSPDLYELIVVDNSADKAEQERFRQDLDISIQNQYLVEKVAGLSRARNIGVRAAKGDIVAFMDDDAEADGTWVAQLIEDFQDANIGIAGGPVRPIWPSTRPVWLHPWLEGFLTIVDRGSQARMLERHEWLAGTNIAFRRDLLSKVGYFNENIGRVGKLLLSNEELLVSERIRDLGYSVLYDPLAKMSHRVHEERVNQAWMRQRVFWQVISELFVDAGAQQVNFDASVSKVLDFQIKLSPKDRGLSGLFLDVEEPELFHQQTEALASLIKLISTDARDWRRFLDTEGS